jgi:hypothetical protein
MFVICYFDSHFPYSGSIQQQQQFKITVKYTDLRLFDTSEGKAIPLQAWTDQEGSRSLKLPDYKTVST